MYAYHIFLPKFIPRQSSPNEPCFMNMAFLAKNCHFRVIFNDAFADKNAILIRKLIFSDMALKLPSLTKI